MGKIITANDKSIQPSQNYLKEDTIQYIINCLLNGDESSLPPIPIVRAHPLNQGYIAIDGHNLLAINALLGRECVLYVANSASDKLTRELTPSSSLDSLNKRNKDLAEKFDQVLRDATNIQLEGIFNFHDLLKKYPHLIELASDLKNK